MARSRHKPSKRGRQPGQKPPARPADPILGAAADATNAKPSTLGFAPEPVAVEPMPPVVVEPEVAAPPPVLNPRTARGLSLLALSQVLKVDRSVIEGWVKKHGCPVLADAEGRGKGNEWSLDVAQVFAWRIDHERKTVLAETGTDGLEPKEKLDLLKLAQQANLVVVVAEVEAMTERANGELKQSFQSLSARIARSMDGFPPERVGAWTLTADAIVRDALANYRNAMQRINLTMSEHVTVIDDADPQSS